MRSRYRSGALVVALALAACTGAHNHQRGGLRPVLPSVVVLPDVSGMTVALAQARLASLGVRAAIVGHETSTAPRDTVYEQAPMAGSQVVKGSTVTLIVSQGPITPAPVPAVGAGAVAVPPTAQRFAPSQ